MQRLNCHLERVTEERDSMKSDRDSLQDAINNLQRDMSASDKAKAQALEVCEARLYYMTS